MTHRGPFQPLPFCDSVIQRLPHRRLLGEARWTGCLLAGGDGNQS